jgi:hypothetical protein
MTAVTKNKAGIRIMTRRDFITVNFTAAPTTTASRRAAYPPDKKHSSILMRYCDVLRKIVFCRARILNDVKLELFLPTPNQEAHMFRKIISFIFVCLLTHTTGGFALAGSRVEKDSRRIERVKAGLAKLGVGKDSRIAIKLTDKTKLSGYLSQVNDDSFVITDLKTGAPTRIAYPEVAQIQGHNLSTGVKIAIGVGIAVLVIGIIILIASKQLDEPF